MAFLGGGALTQTGSPNISGSISVPAGTELLLVVVLEASATAAGGATIGGNAMTVRGSANGWAYGNYSSRLFYYVNPPTGTQTLATSGGTIYDATWGAWDGIDTADPFPGSVVTTTTDETSGSFSATIAATADSEIVVTGIAYHGTVGTLTSVAPAGDTTERAEGTTNNEGAAIYEEPGATSVTMQVSQTGASIWEFGGITTRINLDSGDTTAPVLSSPTATATGSTTGSGSVSTDEGNGTLYWVVTTSATGPSVAQVQAGQDHTGAAAADSGSQAVSGTGVQNVSGGFSGLTPSTTYYAHYQQRDAATNDSTVATSASFTTGTAYSDSRSDSATLSDTVSATVNAAAESVADSTTLADEIAIRLAFDLGDDATMLAETVADVLAVAQSTSDAVGLTDAVAETAAVAESLSDAVAVSELLSAAAITESATDAATLSDSVTISVRCAESVTDALTLTDTVATQVAAVATVLDSYTLGESTVTVLATSLSVLDSLTLTETLAFAVPSPFNVHPSNILTTRGPKRILTWD